MKNFILSLAICIILGVILCGCSMPDKPSVIFNQRPITQENVTDMSSVFAPNTRIYYLILMPKPQYSRFLDIKIIKKGSNDYLGYKLFMTQTIRLKDEEQKYYTDYIVISEKGTYIFKVFSRDNPSEVLTQAQFYVK